jgi:hypothetical protein
MKRFTFVVAAVLAVLVCTGATASAQATAANSAVMRVDFPFVVKGEAMTAGAYLFQLEKDQLLVRSQTGAGQGAMIPVLTRLGRHDRDADAEIVFDKVGGKFLLSEVWIPGQDGYLLLATMEQHDHAVLGGSNPRK